MYPFIYFDDEKSDIGSDWEVEDAVYSLNDEVAKECRPHTIYLLLI